VRGRSGDWPSYRDGGDPEEEYQSKHW